MSLANKVLMRRTGFVRNAKDALLALNAKVAAVRRKERALNARRECTKKMAGALNARLAVQDLSAENAAKMLEDSALLVKWVLLRRTEFARSAPHVPLDLFAAHAAKHRQASALLAPRTILRSKVNVERQRNAAWRSMSASPTRQLLTTYAKRSLNVHPDEFIAQKSSETKDRICEALTICGKDEFMSEEPTATSDRKCKSSHPVRIRRVYCRRGNSYDG